ncbi:hypothetical protein NDK43_09295 [Neobacillus pocheonensis]|uniref:Uncharacterized protein n=1 Tax=Neobacillus pocheonensis TaxID=363869 RepID=A0ABT0W8B2_9BACI|nr:hypothetical protein [Neobacillus pocheonensis]
MSKELPLDIPKKKKKGLFITIGIVLILIAAAGAWYWNYYNTAKAEKQYKTNMALVLLSATTTAAKAEGMINTYQQVWHDDIFNGGYTTSNGTYHSDRLSNFSQAIKDQHDIYDELGDNKKLAAGMISVNTTMDELKNPPSQYKDLYKEIVDLYSSLSRFVDMVNNPTGSLQSYSSDASNMDNDISKKFNSIKVQLPN